MNECRSSHSSRQRRSRREGGQQRPSVRRTNSSSNSTGRRSTTRQRSRGGGLSTSMHNQNNRSSSHFFHDSWRDAFGVDIFDLDPSADFGSSFTFDEAFPETLDSSLESSAGHSSSFFDDDAKPVVKARPQIRRNVSRREGMTKAPSRRSQRSRSERRLATSMRNMNASVEF
ncbi:expressed unknown protein [Seminavis robusta]|uniref:Uncharacterized protein n=1 Tax=Seminavis robusta TaxID=568900 RepID=A0A9N8E595_9STRA|nr:expressed unknown protein [Seminavis robusta]|eukprot:Sro666_g183910.1 n/a (172) ;mRNA; r:6761-7276